MGRAVLRLVGAPRNGVHGTSQDGAEALRSGVAHHRLYSAAVRPPRLASPSGVTRVSKSSSPVTGPAFSVMTPPAVETKVELKGRADSDRYSSATPTRADHLPEGRLLGGIDGEIPVRLYPDPAPGVLAPVGAVGGFPGLRSLIAFGLVCRVVG